jgi:hypothetical protein
VNISEEDIIDCFYNSITDLGIYRDFRRNKPKPIAGLRDMMHDWSEQEEKMWERFLRPNDINLRRTNDNRTDKSQRDYSGPSRKRKPDDLVVGVDHPSRGRRNAHGIQVPIMRQLIAITSGGHSAIPASTRRTSQRIKNPKRMTKGGNRTCL